MWKSHFRDQISTGPAPPGGARLTLRPEPCLRKGQTLHVAQVIPSSKPIAVYVHIPFCPSKCGYCDFNSYAMTGDIIAETTDAIIQQIDQSPLKGRPAKTIFFGGGTPTFLEAKDLNRVLEAVLQTHPVTEETEITSEANPGTVDSSKFKAMRDAGFNRISLGAQSFDTSDLLRLGRVHCATEIGAAVVRARSAGFQRLNVDLMFGLPGQRIQGWRNNLELALSLGTDHLSLYGLTIEQNTRFHRLHQRGMLDLPNDEKQVEMYELAISLCHSHGLEQYEISNFAKPGQECRHNLEYWHCEEYAGYGPGAVGCFGEKGNRTRYTNMKGPKLYVEAIAEGKLLWCDQEHVNAHIHEIERVMMGMRLNEGIESGNIDKGVIDKLVSIGLIGRIGPVGENIALTAQGRHLANHVIAELIPS